MDTEKVVHDLKERFRAPLPDFCRRRIIFWLDEDREYEDKLEDFSLKDAKLVRLDEHNSFAVKKLLGRDDIFSNYVVYCPVSYDSPEDDWLLDVRLYSEEYRSDLISQWMEDMHISPGLTMREAVRGYYKFFNSEERRKKIKAPGGKIETRAQLHLSVLAAICGTNSPTPGAIIRSVLSAGPDRDSNRLCAQLENYGAGNVFWSMVGQVSDYSELDANLTELAAHILLSAASHTMPETALAGLERFISQKRQAWCYDFVSGWLQSDGKDALKDIAREVEAMLALPERFDRLGVAAIQDTACFPCIDECILARLMSDIADDNIDADGICATIEKRRTCALYEDTAPFYEAILRYIEMYRFRRAHAGGFHTTDAARVWKEYTSDYYRMDSLYRNFNLCNTKITQTYRPRLSDLFTEVAERAEQLYVNWFLDKLGENWTKASEQALREQGCINGIPQQCDFYNAYVRQPDRKKVVVVISDALRYEVAVDLAEKLKLEAQAKVELSSMQAVFPTITRFGMAALLPHRQLSVEERANGNLAVLADGLSTDSNNREKVLRATNAKSVALPSSKVMNLKRDELRGITDGMDVVYVYHDTIDAASHADDSGVFSACDRAKDELFRLVSTIVNKMNRTHIIITADHGFLYTREPLREDDKLDKTITDAQDVEVGRRYVIARAGAQSGYLMPVRFIGDSSGLTAFAPREYLRIRMKGGGLNFVHGGASLQELVVPVISYHHLRNQNKEYQSHRAMYDTRPVTISMVTAGHRISNMIFSLRFCQDEPVSSNRRSAKYQLYFNDEAGTQISDIQEIIADRAGANPQDRMFRVSFHLKPLAYKPDADYFLVISDKDGARPPKREKFSISIAFALDDFDF